ncbi:hypothetical protein P872_12420 [Rhodonellum psychrophilum GCM71 = DSM 17998]|uniref:Uncharacterized protein n=1 Tax=Rhodonellum psychrophilum GCM71 = DSM 17998 TaxID=1123057 RepID=U5BRY3_9BACT|nr:hypothetical protein P872_12420 [Rhodonellum psychrophilum GCM71 = DSM 17998]
MVFLGGFVSINDFFGENEKIKVSSWDLTPVMDCQFNSNLKLIHHQLIVHCF